MRVFHMKRMLAFVLSIVLAASSCAVLAACGNKRSNNTETEYTVTFDSQGGSEVDPITVAAGEKAESPDNPTKAGHIFRGWYLDLSDTEAGPFLFDETPITANITLYALWQIRQYTVSYRDPEGNEIEGLPSAVVDWGSTLEKPDESAIAIKEGYLLKWYTSNGDIWDFSTSKVTANTTLTYRLVSTKDSYTAADVYADFYPVFNKTSTDPEDCSGYYNDETETVFYTYKNTNLQQIVLNVELGTLGYDSVSVTARATDTEGNPSGSFSQLRAYIKTDVGGNVSYNDEPSSGYNPLYYYIQSTGTNMELFNSETSNGWTVFTFDLASLKFWDEGERLDSFAFGFVSTELGIEVKSVVFNEVDTTQTFTVSFTDSLGNEVASSQQVNWNEFAQKPAALTDTDTYRYTGEWLDASGEVFDFGAKRIRSNVTLYPQYTIVGKYSWTGAEVAEDFNAVYNASKSNPAGKAALENSGVFTYNNGAAGNSLEQIAIDNLNLEIGSYRYLTVTMRTVNYNGYTYNSAGGFERIRIYVLTDQGGHLLLNSLEDKAQYYLEFTSFNFTSVTDPIDMSAKSTDGWYTVTIDLNALNYYANGSALYGFAIGTTTGTAIKAIEVSEISLSEALASAESYTASFVDQEGNAISAIPDQTVPAGKAPAMPDASLVPSVEDCAFSYWADEEGNAFNFTYALSADVTLHPVYIESWTGAAVSYTGGDIVDSFTYSLERYGSTTDSQKTFDIDEDDVVTATYSASGNKALTGLDLGIRIHEGSTLTIVFSSSNLDAGTHGLTQLKLGVAFRGEDPATTIHNTATNAHYFAWQNMTAGTTSGTNESLGISYSIDEDGVVTVVFDLYAMSQASASKVAEGVDVTYLEAFTFLAVEGTIGSTSAASVAATYTYYSIAFTDVQQKKQGTED